jgi:hypothetical protein
LAGAAGQPSKWHYSQNSYVHPQHQLSSSSAIENKFQINREVLYMEHKKVSATKGSCTGRSDKSKTKLYKFKKKLTGLDATVTKRGTVESGSGSRRGRRQRESEREGRKSESHFPTSRIWTRNYPQERVGGAGSPSHY